MDLNEITDQLVHELTLNLPVHDLNPKPGSLQHALRQCDISGLFDLDQIDDSCELRGHNNCTPTQSNETPESRNELAIFNGNPSSSECSEAENKHNDSMAGIKP